MPTYSLKHMRAAAIYLRQATIAFDESQPDAWTDELNIVVELHDRISELCVIYGDEFCPCIEDNAGDAIHSLDTANHAVL